MSSKFKYDDRSKTSRRNTGENAFLIKTDYNLETSNKISFRYNQLDSSTDVSCPIRARPALPAAAVIGICQHELAGLPELQLFDSREHQVWHRRMELGDRQQHVEQPDHRLHDERREPRRPSQVFPFVDILDGSGTTLHSFGPEPFTPNNELRYHTFQAAGQLHEIRQRPFVDLRRQLREIPLGQRVLPDARRARTLYSLADFYTDMNDYLANPNRTTSPVTLRVSSCGTRICRDLTNRSAARRRLRRRYAQDQWRPLQCDGHRRACASMWPSSRTRRTTTRMPMR